MYLLPQIWPLYVVEIVVVVEKYHLVGVGWKFHGYLVVAELLG